MRQTHHTNTIPLQIITTTTTMTVVSSSSSSSSAIPTTTNTQDTPRIHPGLGTMSPSMKRSNRVGRILTHVVVPFARPMIQPFCRGVRVLLLPYKYTNTNTNTNTNNEVKYSVVHRFFWGLFLVLQ